MSDESESDRQYALELQDSAAFYNRLLDELVQTDDPAVKKLRRYIRALESEQAKFAPVVVDTTTLFTFPPLHEPFPEAELSTSGGGSSGQVGNTPAVPGGGRP